MADSAGTTAKTRVTYGGVPGLVVSQNFKQELRRKPLMFTDTDANLNNVFILSSFVLYEDILSTYDHWN